MARRIDGWAVALTVVGSVGSIALNVAGVGVDADPMDYLVAAVPPLAALLAFGALMRQLHQHLTGGPDVVVLPEPDAAPSADDDHDGAPTGATEYPSAETSSASYANPVEAAIRPLYDHLGTRPTTAQMIRAMSAAGIKDPAASTARDARRRIETREPHLAPATLPTGPPTRPAQPVRPGTDRANNLSSGTNSRLTTNRSPATRSGPHPRGAGRRG